MIGKEMKMDKRGFVKGLGCFCLVLVLSTSALAQVVKVNLAWQDPPKGWGAVEALQPWVKKVEEASKGNMKVDVFYSQTLVKGIDTWNALKNGVADMGWCVQGYWTDLTPLAEVIILPALPFKTGEKGSEVLWKLYEKFPDIQKQFKDVHVLFFWTSPPYFLATTKKQVKTLEDIKGLKIRVTGGPQFEQMKALGAVPVLIPMPDVYQALEKGTVDGMAAPWEAILSFRLYEVVKYYSFAPLCATYHSMSMSNQKWNSLPKNMQEVLTSVSGVGAAQSFGRNFFDTAEGAVAEQVKKGNYSITRYSLPPEEMQKWTKVSGEPLWKEWVKKMEGKGFPVAPQILDTALEMVKK
jgi:TRAP-type C4-dicarboxylate transport system substrate-binding protein